MFPVCLQAFVFVMHHKPSSQASRSEGFLTVRQLQQRNQAGINNIILIDSGALDSYLKEVPKNNNKQ